MPNNTVRILQINTTDRQGGAAQVAWSLHQAFKQRNLETWLAAGYKRSEDLQVIQIDNTLPWGAWGRLWLQIAKDIARRDKLSPLQQLVLNNLDKFVHPLRSLGKYWDRLNGREVFRFPGIWSLFNKLPINPSIILAHNLHGGYFDLEALPMLAQKAPLTLILADSWLLSGHCAQSLGCMRWKIGCGNCPDLTIYPELHHDGTASNWKRKQQIYERCKFYLVTPSQWLMDKVNQSMLVPSVIKSRVIPHGIDLAVFKPDDKAKVRARLGLSQTAKVIAFAAISSQHNPFKDYQTVNRAIEIASRNMTDSQEIVFLNLGGQNQAIHEQLGQIERYTIPFLNSPQEISLYYQASDIYLHATPPNAETFGLAITEAKACGAPAIATASGGIPEQIENGENGFLVSPGDAEAMASRLTLLLHNDNLRKSMGENAASDARRRFGQDRMVNEYLDWFEEVLSS